MQRTYMSRAVSRAWAAEMPVGDPFGGPAYGKREDPISVIGGIASIVAGIEATGIIGGLLIAGGAMTILGSATGNKTLSSLGMVASLAGGLGMGFDKMGEFFSSAGNAATEAAAPGFIESAKGLASVPTEAEMVAGLASVNPAEAVVATASPAAVAGDAAANTTSAITQGMTTPAPTGGESGIASVPTDTEIAKGLESAKSSGLMSDQRSFTADGAGYEAFGQKGNMGASSSGGGIMDRLKGLLPTSDSGKQALWQGLSKGADALLSAPGKARELELKQREIDLMQQRLDMLKQEQTNASNLAGYSVPVSFNKNANVFTGQTIPIRRLSGLMGRA